MAIHSQAEEITPKVQYEFNMLEWVANKIREGDHRADGQTKSMLLEVFLLHTRVLYDFFIKSPEGDDVSAEHFFDNSSIWNSRKCTLCQMLRQEQRRLNKKLAHLTYARLTEDERWEINGICSELLNAKQEFLGSLASDQRQWFK